MKLDAALPLVGVDFTSAPGRRKPITVARGRRAGAWLQLEGLEAHASFSDFEALLAEPGPWLGAFDFPFGLPREFVDALQLGGDIDAIVATLRHRCRNRMAFRALVDSWCDARPAGARLLHRRTDRARPGVGSTSPMQTRFVPVGFMFFEGASRLVDAGVQIPGMRQGDAERVAVEAYPGMVARALIARRSYKNKSSIDRRLARQDIVAALEQGRALDMRLALPVALRERLIDDASGDVLDAVLCLMQAAWAAVRPGYGLPHDFDPVEGWIVSA